MCTYSFPRAKLERTRGVRGRWSGCEHTTTETNSAVQLQGCGVIPRRPKHAGIDTLDGIWQETDGSSGRGWAWPASSLYQRGTPAQFARTEIDYEARRVSYFTESSLAEIVSDGWTFVHHVTPLLAEGFARVLDVHNGISSAVSCSQHNIETSVLHHANLACYPKLAGQKLGRPTLSTPPVSWRCKF